MEFWKTDLFVQDNAQEGIIDVDLAVVFDEAQFAEFVHEKINPGASGADHLSQRLLRNLELPRWRLVFLAIAREQQQGAREAFLTGIEELVYQVFFNVDISLQHMRDEAVGECVLGVEHAAHFLFLNDEYRGRSNRGSGRHANGLPRQTSFAKKITGSKYCDNGFFAGLIDHCKSYAAFLNVDNTACGIPLRK